ncbi:MAG: folylpolyglutamate synthase/dihydrofolate synthase family protein [Actinomycetota bacterium]
MSLERQLRWLDNQVNLEAGALPKAGATAALSTEPIENLLALLGDPHRDAPAVHLTGTNGKGSTAHLTTLLLREHGLRVGTYASPHVSAINERIQIDAEPITDDDLAMTLEVVRLAAEQLERPPTWFELVTAAAYRAFSDAAVDVMVIEVGMLGRFDATNVVDSTVSVITNVGFDHTDGEDGWREKIAWEKAGIVTPGSTLVMGELDDDLHRFFEDEGPGTILRLGQQFELLANEIGVGGRVIDVRTPRDVYEAVLVSLHGRHQGVNAAVAIATAEAFIDGGLDRDHLDSAFAQALMRGRLEVISPDPLIVIDGAHNVDGARTAARTFTDAFHVYGRRLLVVGMMAEKDPVEMLEALDARSAEILVVCAVDWPRAMPAGQLADAARSMGLEPEVAASPAEAIELALSLSTEGDAILCAGSLYVAGGVRNRVLIEE